MFPTIKFYALNKDNPFEMLFLIIYGLSKSQTISFKALSTLLQFLPELRLQCKASNLLGL